MTSSVTMTRRRDRANELYISATVKRPDTCGDIVEHDVCITFRIDRSYPGYAGDSYEPPHGPSFDLDFIEAQFDVGPRTPTPEQIAELGGPLTKAEIQTLKTWFDANHEEADEIALEHMGSRSED